MKRAILIVLALAALSGCTQRVPPGYVGMVMTPSGLTGQVLQPGNHSCYGRDRLFLIETREYLATEKLSILCADNLNFAFDLKVRARLRAKDGKAVRQLFDAQGSRLKMYEGSNQVFYLPTEVIYATYVQPESHGVARTVVSKYKTTDINPNREKIQADVQAKLKEAIKGSPMELLTAFASNFDFPDVVTKGVENAKRKQIEIQEEQARQEMKMLQAKNRRLVAEAEKLTRQREAEAEAVYIRTVGSALTDKYLRQRELDLKKFEIETRAALYEKLNGQGTTLIVPDGQSITPLLPVKK